MLLLACPRWCVIEYLFDELFMYKYCYSFWRLVKLSYSQPAESPDSPVVNKHSALILPQVALLWNVISDFKQIYRVIIVFNHNMRRDSLFLWSQNLDIFLAIQHGIIFFSSAGIFISVHILNVRMCSLLFGCDNQGTKHHFQI